MGIPRCPKTMDRKGVIMKIDFGGMEEKRLSAFKGGKGDTIARMHVDEMGKIMYGRLEPGSSIGFHKHETNSEIIYILSGRAMTCSDADRQLLNGRFWIFRKKLLTGAVQRFCTGA